MSAYFEFRIEGFAESRRFELSDEAGEAVIGRSSECQWMVSSGAVSRRHARVQRRGKEVTIEDLGSSNGTFVNGERLTGPRALRDQDRVQLGSVEGRFVMPPEPASDATIAFDAQQTILAPPKARAAPPPPPPPPPPSPPPPASAPPAPPTPVPAAKRGATGTHTITAESAAAAAAPPPAPAPKVETATATPATAPLAPAPAPAPAAPPPPSRPAPAASTTARRGPSYVELAVIAIVSFLAVFTIGVLLIRFVL